MKRGAKIYAEIVGYGATGDAYHITAAGAGRRGRSARDAPRAERCRRLRRRTSSTSTRTARRRRPTTLNETRAIKAVFGEHAKTVNVSSTKSATGHMLGAAGAVEFVICSLVVRDGVIPPTINYANPDPESTSTTRRTLPCSVTSRSRSATASASVGTT